MMIEDARKYAPVLGRMVEILGSENTSFGDALNRAQRELRIEAPEHVQEELLAAAFKVISGGRVPGAPDA